MRKLLALVTLIALPLAASCAVHQDSTPSAVAGPAETGLSLKILATPDRLFQDGLQSSRIAVTALDTAGHPVAANVRLIVSPSNFGTLSTPTVTTGTDAANPVSVIYIPPAQNTGSSSTVTIFGEVIGSNSVTASQQQVSLVVSPTAAISAAAPTASMAISPNSVITNRPAVFDGSSSCGGQVVSGACSSTSALTDFIWNFGDSTPTVRGQVVGHTYASTGNFTVTLTVTNDQGRQASQNVLLQVTTILPPASSFVVSPTTIHKTVDTVNFNGAASTAAGGHIIVRYDWNFGDGTTASTTTPSASHVYATNNTFKSTLTVTDDVGQTATSGQDVVVLP